jgi:hypothetical protein
MFTIPNREKVESSPVNKKKTFLHKNPEEENYVSSLLVPDEVE